MFRKANRKDLEEIVVMLADDDLGKNREIVNDGLHQSYINAFDIINSDKNQELIVLENETGEIIGTFQLTFIQYLTYKGGIRAQIEAVRVRKDQRGSGIGRKMIEWAINKSKERNAHLVQLTSDKLRPEAIKFYEEIGFISSHEGMKLHLK